MFFIHFYYIFVHIQERTLFATRNADFRTPSGPVAEGFPWTRLSHIAAATYELLVLIGRYDEEKGWVQHGMASCANWLQWRCGTNPGAAREKVRVARALPGLPKISAAFREGRVSYSKVRAMTRIATPENESSLLSIARYGTARQFEQVVSNYRMCGRLKLLNEAREADALRELSWLIDEDGCRVLKGRFTPEQGAVIRQGLEKAMDTLFDERQEEQPDVSAETSRRLACDAAVVRLHEGANGEPLSIGRKSRTIPPAIRRALQKRDGGEIDYNYARGLLEQYDSSVG